MSSTVLNIEEKILHAFAFANPTDWSGMKDFAADGFYKESGLADESLRPMAPEDSAKLRQLFDVLEETHGTARGDRIGNYRKIYAGAQYLESIGHPFPKPSLLQSALPLTKAIEVGEVIMPIKAAIMKLDFAGHTLDESDYFQRQHAMDSVGEKAALLKKILPETKTTLVLNFLSLNGSLRPELAQRATVVLERILGDGAPFQAFPAERGNAPNLN